MAGLKDNVAFAGKYKQLQGWLKKNEKLNNEKVVACREYLAALNQWNKEDSALRTKAGGEVPPLITAQKRDKLLELHKKIAEKTDAFLKIAKDDPKLTALVRGLSLMAADNFMRLLRYDPKELKTMEGIEESTQKLRLDISNTPFSKTVAGGSFSREVLSYKDNRGRVVNGVFTERTLLTPLADLEKGLKDIADKLEDKKPDIPVELFLDLMEEGRSEVEEEQQAKESQREVAALIRALVNKIVAHQKRNGTCKKVFDNDERSSAAAELVSCIEDIWENYDTRVPRVDEIAEVLVGFLNKLGENRYDSSRLIRIVGSDLLCDICVLFVKTYKPLFLRIHGIGYPEGMRKDSLNTTMSSVADLLGVPYLLARSEPARLTLKDGRVREGTFMHAAKGVDLRRHTLDTPSKPTAFLEGKATEKSREFLRKLADLQVLDYICGNWHRHWGNMIYCFDENGNPVDVRGIDNDECFSILDPGGKCAPLTPPEKMVAISQSMVDKVRELTPETLRYLLRARGLHERLIESAVKRLEHTKQVIAESIPYYKQFDAKREDAKNNPYCIPEEAKGHYVRIIPDKDFSKISIKGLCYPPSHQEATLEECNIFRRVTIAMEEKMQSGEEQRKLQADRVTGAENRTDAAVLRGWLNKLKALEEQLPAGAPEVSSSDSYMEKLETWVKQLMSCTSAETTPAQKYESMKQGLKNLRKNHEALLERLEKPSDARQAVVTVKDLSELTVQYQALEKLTREYLRSVEGATEPEVKARVDVAKKVLKLAKKGGRERIDEWAAVERNTLRALEEFDRKQENKAKKDAAKKKLTVVPKTVAKKPIPFHHGNNVIVTASKGKFNGTRINNSGSKETSRKIPHPQPKYGENRNAKIPMNSHH